MPRKSIILLIALLLSLAACAKNTPSPNTNAAPKSDPDIKDVDGFTPLMNVIKTGDLEGAQRTIAEGSDINAATPQGITALFIAAGMGHKEIVKVLIEKGANVNQMTPGKFTPLMQAALTGQTEITQMLLDAGADPTVKDISNKTATDWAAQNNHKETADFLAKKTGIASNVRAVKVGEQPAKKAKGKE
jgi:ankyrin repeat protein